ncbi:hypothetical protein [Burkholderia vietnamiensis]|nr:hypothetical protein [Burkholderia vietnamiensis]
MTADSQVCSRGTAWLVAVHFWFGDTQASARKTELMAQANQGVSE